MSKLFIMGFFTLSILLSSFPSWAQFPQQGYPDLVCGNVTEVVLREGKFSVWFLPEESHKQGYLYALTSRYLELQRALQTAKYTKQRICVTGYGFPGFEYHPVHVLGVTVPAP
jgi:hypothetical protein